MDKNPTESGKIRAASAALWALLLAFVWQSAVGAQLVVEVRDQNGQPVSDAVVSYVRAAGHGVPQASTTPVVMAQERQTFVPRVIAVPRGGSVQFTNRDATQHHVYSFSSPKTFEIPLFGQTEKPVLVFDQPGVVAVGCNIHDSMKAFVIVLDTPHFAVSGVDGIARVEIGDGGSGQLDLWHERLQAPQQPKSLNSGAVTEKQVLTLTLKTQPPAVRRGLGAWKKP